MQLLSVRIRVVIRTHYLWHSFRFGPFELDLTTAELRRNQIPLRVEPKPLMVLALLSNRAGELVPREEIVDLVWGNSPANTELSLNSCVRELRRALHDSVKKPRYIETLRGRGYRLIVPVDRVPAGSVSEMARSELLDLLERADQQRQVAATSVVVLPFQNLTNDPDVDYLVDGFWEALVTELANISSLRVISQNSARQYRKHRKTLREIATELQVDWVLEGSVLLHSGQVRITGQLVDAVSDRHLWAGRFDRPLKHLLTLQGEIAREIAGHVTRRQTPRITHPLARPQGIEPEAHKQFLKGRYQWNLRTDEGLRRSIAYYRRALKIDPDFALADAGIADAYVTLGAFGFIPPREAYQRALAAAETALARSPHLAQAHAALGYARLLYEWDVRQAEACFQRAISLQPSYSTAHLWYCTSLAAERRFEDALREVRLAQELDPFSRMINARAGWVLYHQRQYEAAKNAFRDTLEMDAQFYWTHWCLGQTLLQLRRTPEALRELQKAAELTGEDSRLLAALAHALGICGERFRAENILNQVLQMSTRRYVAACDVATIHLGLGDSRKTIRWLERALEDREPGLLWIGTDPVFDPIREDPQFREILANVRASPGPF